MLHHIFTFSIFPLPPPHGIISLKKKWTSYLGTSLFCENFDNTGPSLNPLTSFCINLEKAATRKQLAIPLSEMKEEFSNLKLLLLFMRVSKPLTLKPQWSSEQWNQYIFPFWAFKYLFTPAVHSSLNLPLTISPPRSGDWLEIGI